MSILEVKNLSHGFGDRAIFENVSFRLLKGEHIGLVGANGEGKSTFMSIVTGKLQPDEGKVEWSKYVTAGYLDQHAVLEKGMTVRDVLRTAFDELFKTEERINEIYMSMADEGADVDALMEEVGELQDRLETRDFYTLDAKIDEVARALGVMDFGMDTDVTDLSGGQRQRVAIARAIINQPRVVLLDEPLSALDLKLRTEMQYELRELQQRLGITFVFVTHDQEEALAMSDWIFVMNDGEIVQSGTPVDIYDEPINHFVATFIGESNILPGVMIEDYLVEFNGKRFESVDGGMRPNEPVEVVIRPEDLQITLPEEGKLQVRVETQLFRGVHYEIIAYDNLGNEWMIHSTRKAIEGEIIGLDFTPEDIHIMRLNETEEEFDARIEEYVEVEEHEDGLINAIEEERYEENS